ncbi:MAG: hypothetical protein M3P50_10535, partial [Actinomycetota bacterium]|nr:hypothetical protein [Actinomycetota bacterium]
GAAWRALRARKPLAQAAAAGLLLAFLVPLWGVAEKLITGLRVLAYPGYSLRQWGGDLVGYFPEPQFLAFGAVELWWIPAAVIAGFCAWELRRLPRPLAAGLAAVILTGVLVAAQMRLRDYGWYFHFKVLAFAAPLAIALAAAGMARLRAAGAVLLAVWLVAALSEARDVTTATANQLPRTTLELRDWAAALPPDASVRLDMDPGAQLWAGYMLAARPVCSTRPLLDTSYPHVPFSIEARYVLTFKRPRPADATGPPLRANVDYGLWKLRPGLPGPDLCSRRMVQTVTRVGLD